jgi:deoxyadenosine/deoxycytidine kinase
VATPVICLEGPSAVGKITVAGELSKQFGVKIVPEINQLFQRSDVESRTWYFEKQVERRNLAQAPAAGATFNVLDGDPFQPF